MWRRGKIHLHLKRLRQACLPQSLPCGPTAAFQRKVLLHCPLALLTATWLRIRRIRRPARPTPARAAAASRASSIRRRPRRVSCICGPRAALRSVPGVLRHRRTASTAHRGPGAQKGGRQSSRCRGEARAHVAIRRHGASGPASSSLAGRNRGGRRHRGQRRRRPEAKRGTCRWWCKCGCTATTTKAAAAAAAAQEAPAAEAAGAAGTAAAAEAWGCVQSRAGACSCTVGW